MRDGDLSQMPAAYGGPGWSPRRRSLSEELGDLWAACGISNEWERLRAVLLHAPGAELEASDPNAAQQLASPEHQLAAKQHEALSRAYEGLGVQVLQVEPSQLPPPNLMFVADLFMMTPEGAIVGRPASTVRAGEERWLARRLADLGVPILRTVRGCGSFEGADAIWLDEQTVLLGLGLRTNKEGANQVAGTLAELGVSCVQTEQPVGTMHLMGQLRIVDRDLAFAWPGRLSFSALDALRERGYRVHFIPDEREAREIGALNVVTIGPREIVMPSGCPVTQRFYETQGVTCHTVVVDELLKAAGGIACMSGILSRKSDSAPS